MRSKSSGRDESTSGEAVPSTAGSSLDGGVNEVVVLSPEPERPTMALEEPMPNAEKSWEDDGEDNMPLARWSRHLAWVVLIGMRKVAYVPSGTPSSVEFTASKVNSETDKWNCYCR